MTGVYEKLEELYRKHHPAQFSIAIAHLMVMGFQDAAKITDEEINEAKGNAFITTEFWQDTLKLIREIAQKYEPLDFIKFCEVAEPLDVRFFADCPTRKDLMTYVENAIRALNYRRVKEEDIIGELGLEEDAELFGLDYKDEEEN